MISIFIILFLLTPLPTDNIQKIGPLSVIILLLCSLFLFIRKSWIIYSLYNSMKVIENQCRNRKNAPLKRPTRKMNEAIMNLRKYLIIYSKGTNVLFPLEGYYSSQLQRRIDLIFTQIMDGLYGTRSEEIRKNQDRQAAVSIYSIYDGIESWNRRLSNHLFEERQLLDDSSAELATLGSFLESSITVFDKIKGMESSNHIDDVRSYHDRKEEAAKARWSNIVDLLKLGLVAIISALLAFAIK
jgi:hypothetical protein